MHRNKDNQPGQTRSDDARDSYSGVSPGKVTNSSMLPPSSAPVQSKASAADHNVQTNVKSAAQWTADPFIDAALRGTSVQTAPAPQPVQTKGRNQAAAPAEVQQIAADGLNAGGTSMPHLDRIQSAFGPSHDLSSVTAHVGGVAADACTQIGAEAYASGEQVAFKQAPDLHTAAHEAAHVVQQRSGVQLRGGVGEVGDRYEQHADQVADLVVQGASAEHLLGGGSNAETSAGVQKRAVQRDGGDEAGGEAAAAPAATSGYDALSDSEKRQLEDILNNIPSIYVHMLLKQRDAVTDLLDAVKEEEPPSFWDVVLKVAVEVALTAALGPIGTAIGAKIAQEGARLGRQMIAAAVSSGVTKAIEESIKSGYGAIFASVPGRDPRDKFFKTQRNTLTNVSEQTSSHFNTERKEQIRQSADPLAEARALNNAVIGNSQQAYTEQRNKTMDEWITYRAKSEHGDDDGRTNLGKADLEDTSEAGILGIEIRTTERPPNPANPDIEITEINLGGAHSNIKEIAKTRGTIGAMNVPKSINGTVNGPTSIGLVGSGHLGIGLSADGVVAWEDANANGVRWLKMYATGTVSSDPAVNDAIADSEKFVGIRKLFNHVNQMSISSLS